MGVFLEEVVFDLPCVIESEFVREDDLFECVLEKAKFVVFTPGPRKLMLVEDAKFHVREDSTYCLMQQIALGRCH